MVFYIKQKVFSWRDRFFVYDEDGNEVFYVEGKVFSWHKKLFVYDMNDRPVAFVGERFSWLRPRYSIEIQGGHVCDLVKELTFFKPKYRLDGVGMRLDGDFWAHEYALYSESTGSVISELSKKWLSWGDSYRLEVFEGGAELFCLCVALAVDCVLEREGTAAVSASV